MSQVGVQPYNVAKLITASATVNFDGTTQTGTTKAIPCEAIMCDGGGDIVGVLENYTTATITTAAGQILPIKAIRVNVTGTTATGNLYALYTV